MNDGKIIDEQGNNTPIAAAPDQEGGFGAQIAKMLYGRRYKPSRATLARLRRISSWNNRLALILIIAAIIAGSATYGALNALPPFGDNPNSVIWLLNIDLIILLLLVIQIARRIVSLFSGRRRGIAGSRLHVRLVFIFSLLAATPAIIMTVFSAFFTGANPTPQLPMRTVVTP